MQSCGGLGEIEILSHRQKIPQVPQFHNVSGSLAGSHVLATISESALEENSETKIPRNQPIV